MSSEDVTQFNVAGTDTDTDAKAQQGTRLKDLIDFDKVMSKGCGANANYAEVSPMLKGYVKMVNSRGI